MTTDVTLSKNTAPQIPSSPGKDFLSAVNRARGSLGQSGIYIAFVVILALTAVATGGKALTPANLSNLVGQYGYVLILAVGMVIVIIAGHIDLSVGSIVGFAGAMSGVFIVNHHLPVWLGVILTLIVGGLVGAWQGFWVAYFGIPAFIVTLAGMLVFRGATMIALGNLQISPFPESYRNIASGFLDGYAGKIGLPSVLGGGRADVFTLLIGAIAVVFMAIAQNRTRRARQRYKQKVPSMLAFTARLVASAVVIMYFVFQLSKYKGLPVVLIILAFLVLVYGALTNRTVFGRHVYAIGGNLQAAALSGVKVKAVTFWVFVNMGVLAALAGIVFAARLNLANPTNGTTFELSAIAAVFIGGAAVTGGVGRVTGAIVGGLIMGVLLNGMSLKGVDNSYQQVIQGLVLLAAVAFDVFNKRRSTGR